MPSKKELTRNRIIAVALELFAQRGYDATTVGQIAAGAGVTEMTFFRHFAAKENLLVDDPYDPLMAAAVAQQPRELDPLTRVARGIRQAWHGLPLAEEGDVRDRLRFASASPTLRAVMMRNTSATEAAIVAALPDVDASTARIAAAAALAALMTALLEWAASDVGELGAVIDRALDVLEVRNG
jgi:AcrR family transcriptional regulator